jgi:hypothetical protein
MKRKQDACSGMKLIKKFYQLAVEPAKVNAFPKMAERTGLEPATPGVTGRYSNQLNYRSA